MDYFRLLPEGCISEIISFTSPKDAATSSAISRGFKSAAESDVVWGKFLPSDYQHIISRSNSLLVSPSKKELYFSLCDSPILTDGGKLPRCTGAHQRNLVVDQQHPIPKRQTARMQQSGATFQEVDE
ncbi:PREDICTED: F-box protein SKIP3-like isoform X2 [Nicotiana attenuata]|uniref:F-box protein SKIP3-like isoform X2 n=1 Tax=Nicotiana attenuata TaxID=49451 RepID=UPI00090597C9|nr:PREDICTED: F-box protein SKIP3-like isoform X2 [Nicotiana attenuata]